MVISSSQTVTTPVSGHLVLGHQYRIISRVIVNHCPGHPRRLVRQRYDNHVDMLARRQFPQPLAEPVIPAFRVPDYGTGTVNQKLPQVAVTSFTDPQQPVLSAGTVLARCEPQ